MKLLTKAVLYLPNTRAHRCRINVRPLLLTCHVASIRQETGKEELAMQGRVDKADVEGERGATESQERIGGRRSSTCGKGGGRKSRCRLVAT